MINNEVPVKLKKIHPDADIPKYSHSNDGCFDLQTMITGHIFPGDRRLIPTGIAIQLPVGYEVQVRPRSGLSKLHGITVLNSPGTVDCDYTGELKVILINHGDTTFEFNAGDRIAQAGVKPVYKAIFEVVEELDWTIRGTNGFNSTGVKTI